MKTIFERLKTGRLLSPPKKRGKYITMQLLICEATDLISFGRHLVFQWFKPAFSLAGTKYI